MSGKGVLALTIKPGYRVRVGNGYVTNLSSKTVRLAFQFPQETRILRSEIEDRKDRKEAA
jgi:sRNA-binding carbon storage regulator CsrA